MYENIDLIFWLDSVNMLINRVKDFPEKIEIEGGNWFINRIPPRF